MDDHGNRLAQRVAERLFEREGTSAAWGVTIDEVREGYARVRMTIRSDMLNGHGIAHGGMVFALADTAFAYACNSRNVATVAAQASIILLSAVEQGEELIAEAAEQAASGRSSAYAVEVRTADGRAVAQFQGLARTIGGAIIR